MSRRRNLDPARCVKQVRMQTSFARYHQCTRARTHGEYCWQHSPDAERKRREETDRRENIKWRRQLKHRYGPAFFTALQAIAAGHNDPQKCAREALALVTEKEDQS